MSTDVWVAGMRTEIITAEQIKGCRIAKPRGWKNGMRNSLWIGAVLATLLEHPEDVDAETASGAIVDFSVWWMACFFPHALNEHAMFLVQQATPENEAAIEVLIEGATPAGVTVSTVHMGMIGDPYLRDGADATATIRDGLAELECPPGHTRVLFLAPSLRVVIGVVAEMEGLQ
jgi:hypothetical protein